MYALAAGLGSSPGPNDCNGTATETAYYTSAIAVTPGMTGNRAFAGNSNHVIWQDVAGGGAAPPAEPFAITATVTPIQ